MGQGAGIEERTKGSGAGHRGENKAFWIRPGRCRNWNGGGVEGSNKLYPSFPIPRCSRHCHRHYHGHNFLCHRRRRHRRRPAGAVKPGALNPLNGRSLYRCDDTQKQSDNSSYHAATASKRMLPTTTSAGQPSIIRSAVLQGYEKKKKRRFYTDFSLSLVITIFFLP